VQSALGRTEDIFSRERVTIAKRMLWYPVAYLTCIMPIAIIRLVGLREENVPESVWIFGMFFLFALGAVDSIIYTTTRKLIKPINFPTHMRTFSSDNSSTKGGTISRNTSVYKSNPYKPPDKPSYGLPPAWEDVSETSGDKSGQFADPRLGAIHVTLERIEEVI